MNKFNKVFTLILILILIFLLILLINQKISFNKNNIFKFNETTIKINNKNSNNKIDIENNIQNIDLSKKLKDNEFKVFTNKIYSLEDTIDLNIPSKNSNYIEKQNKIIEIIDGKIEHYNLNITNYYFDTELSTFNFIINIQGIEKDNISKISSENFILSYESLSLKNLVQKEYELNSKITRIELIFELPETLDYKDINVNNLKLKYLDNFNLRNIKIY